GLRSGFGDGSVRCCRVCRLAQEAPGGRGDAAAPGGVASLSFAATTLRRHGFRIATARRAARMLAPAAMMNTRSQLPVAFWIELAYGTRSEAVPFAVYRSPALVVANLVRKVSVQVDGNRL